MLCFSAEIRGFLDRTNDNLQATHVVASTSGNHSPLELNDSDEQQSKNDRSEVIDASDQSAENPAIRDSDAIKKETSIEKGKEGNVATSSANATVLVETQNLVENPQLESVAELALKQCFRCGKLFGNESSLLKHLKKRHGIETSISIQLILNPNKRKRTVAGHGFVEEDLSADENDPMAKRVKNL